jgi:membrane associated rhomboid family serine protease
MFPYKDENPTFHPTIVTWALVGLNVAVWVLVQGFGSEPALTRSVCHLGLIPGELLGTVAEGTTVPLGPAANCQIGAPNAFTPLTSMFLHGGWLHLAGNMLFLWVFGDNVEDSMGHVRFLIFYVLCGLAAAGAQMALNPGSAVPMVGASGAIGGVMGAYVVLYPKVRIRVLIFLGIFITTIVVPAYLMLGYWFFLQILGGLPSLAGEGGGGGTAFGAHVGGFAAGALLILVFKKPERVAAHKAAISAMPYMPAGRVHRGGGYR